MNVYTYEAIRRGGERVSGELEAASRAEACDKLDRIQLQPVTLKPKGPELASNRTPAQSRSSGIIHLKRPQIITFTEEISDLLEAGLQLEPALRVMEQRQDKSALKSVAAALRQEVRQGRSFSEALRTVSPSYGELYCNMAAAGEGSGTLPQILRRQLDHLVLMQELQDRVRSALVYPSIIMGAGIVMLFLFMTYLVPQLTVLFTKTGKELPFATRLLIGTSDFLASYWWAIITALTAAGIVFARFIKTPAGKLWWDRVHFELPIVGEILKVRFFAQFAQTMATLVKNGITMLQALRLVNAASTNSYLHRLLRQTSDRVGEGLSLTTALSRTKYFPPLMLDIISVGEQTGNIGLALEKAAQRYDRELKGRIQRLTALIEPAVIILMALLVGLVAYSMITGIFQGISGLRTRL